MCCLEFRTWQELGAGLLKLRIADTAATAAAACLLCRIRGLVGKISQKNNAVMEGILHHLI